MIYFFLTEQSELISLSLSDAAHVWVLELALQLRFRVQGNVTHSIWLVMANRF